MRERLNADEWAELVEEWDRTGGTAIAFAEAHGIAEASLRWWRTELARRRKRGRGRPPASARPVTLARVVRDGEVPPKGTAAASAAAIVVGSARIIVEPGFDAVLLRSVVDALGAPK